MRMYTIDNDLNDEKGFYLTFLYIITGLILGIGFVLIIWGAEMSVIAWALLAGALGISMFLKHRQRIAWASWAYLGGLLGAATALLWYHGPNTYIYLLFLIPIALSGLLLEAYIDSVTMLAVAGMFGASLFHGSFLTALGYVFVPTCIAIGLAVIAHVAAYNNYGLLNWAVDSEQKNSHRAEMFYRQGEQLKQALLDVQHTRSNLERMNVQLTDAQSTAQRASNAKSVFLSNMSHELRTPLNVIIGYTSSMLNMPQMYGNTPLPPVFQSDIELIKENGEYLVDLINDILDLSKIEAGRLELHCLSVNPVELLRGTIATSIGLLKGKPMQIIPDFPDKLPVVWADPMRVRQIILNLMSNAIKFTESGSITLSAKVEGEWMRISVIDTGIGIPTNALPTIFDRFKQAEHDTDKRYGGTGLGLDISQQLSRMHGGELTVTSEVSRGSNFSFTLALAANQTAETPKAEIPGTGKIFEHVEFEEVHSVLLVEDDANTRTMMRRMLENESYVVVDTSNGAQVMELASGLLPSVIILDILLPNQNGWAILEQLKAGPETAAIPVIICSVNSDKDRSAQLGAALHLLKPIEAKDLLSGVYHVLFTLPATERA